MRPTRAAWGLALSGGGLLGAAHLGVLQGLEAMGLEAPVLAGTSAGGLVVGLSALGVPTAAIIAAGQRVSRLPELYFRPALRGLWDELRGRGAPASGLLDPTAFLNELLALAPEARTTADWRRPAVVTAADLVDLRATAFAARPVRPPARANWRVVAGAPLRVALQATMAEPGLFEAAEDGGHVYVDGGLADTLPEDWAAALGARRVLAVQVAPAQRASDTRMGLLEVFSRSIDFATHDAEILRRPRRPVLRVQPDTSGVPFAGFSHFSQLVEAGRTAVQEQAGAIRRFVRA